jgi:hypothetical protein
MTERNKTSQEGQTSMGREDVCAASSYRKRSATGRLRSLATQTAGEGEIFGLNCDLQQDA